VGRVVPGDVHRSDGVADEEVLGVAAAVDEERFRVALDEVVGLGGQEILHWAIVVRWPWRGIAYSAAEDRNAQPGVCTVGASAFLSVCGSIATSCRRTDRRSIRRAFR